MQSHEMMTLNAQQQAVFDACVNEQDHVFCTGGGGTGKSWLLRKIISRLRDDAQKNNQIVAVTSSTGVSALNVGGVTLHSFAGTQILEDQLPEMKIRANRGASRANWLDVDVLIIDEISMISGTLFENLSEVAKHIRHSDEPFGGIRLMLFGDFLQLPPVSKGRRRTSRVFETSAWKKMNIKCFELTEVVRQQDKKFRDMLEEIRMGSCSKDTAITLKQLDRDPAPISGIKPVQLYALRKRADDYNGAKLNALTSDIQEYTAIDSGNKNLLSDCAAPRTVVVKVGAQVMFNRNLSPSVVNGTVGLVTGMKYDSTLRKSFPVVSIKSGDGAGMSHTVYPEKWESVGIGAKVLACREQIPLILAWAVTIHKSQGQTIPLLQVDLDRVFEKGQTYVALSRATDMSHLQLKNFSRGKVEADEKSVKFYETLRELATKNSESYAVVVMEADRKKVSVGFAD